MPEKTVSVTPETEAQLSRLAERTGLSIADIVRSAVEAYEARMFFDEMDETYAVLEADFKEWGAYMADLSAWIDAGEPKAQLPETDSPPDSAAPASATSASTTPEPAGKASNPQGPAVKAGD